MRIACIFLVVCCVGCSKYLTKSDALILVNAHNQLVAKIQELEKLCPKPEATPEATPEAPKK